LFQLAIFLRWEHGLVVQKWHLKVHNLTLYFFYNFNNYQTINPLIIHYAFNHKY
jgi:hypothetical protein